MKTPDETLIKALRIMARQERHIDGVTEGMLEEAANRLEELSGKTIAQLKAASEAREG